MPTSKPCPVHGVNSSNCSREGPKATASERWAGPSRAHVRKQVGLSGYFYIRESSLLLFPLLIGWKRVWSHASVTASLRLWSLLGEEPTKAGLVRTQPAPTLLCLHWTETGLQTMARKCLLARVQVKGRLCFPSVGILTGTSHSSADSAHPALAHMLHDGSREVSV